MSSFHPPPPWSLSQKGKNFFVKGTHVSYVSKTVFGVTVVTWTSQCLIRFYHQHTYIFFLAILWGSYTFYFGNGSEAQWSRKVDSIISSPPLCFITAVYSPQSFNVWYQMLDLVCKPKLIQALHIIVGMEFYFFAFSCVCFVLIPIDPEPAWVWYKSQIAAVSLNAQVGD